MKKIYYRLKNDRKFFSPSINAVIEYAALKYNLSADKILDLHNYGITQDGKIEIHCFTSK